DRGGRSARGRRDRQLLHRDRRRRRREPPPGTPRPAREPRRARHPDRLLRADEARRGGGRAGDRPRDRAQPPRCAGGRRHRAATASRARAGRQRPPGARRLDLRRTHLRGTEPLVRLLARAPALCPHLHVPLQAGDDTVLRRMRRRYDAALARERLAMVRELLPEAAIGTDLIAGFPGEDEAAFERTLAFVEASPLTYLHVFPYSVRSGTTAAKLDGRNPP